MASSNEASIPSEATDGAVSPSQVRASTYVAPATDHRLPEELARARRNRKPVFFCRWITARPKLSFGLCLSGHISLIFLTFVLLRLGLDVLPIEFGRVPMFITSDVDYLRGEAWSHKDVARAENPVTILKRGSISSGNSSERTVTADTITLMFELKGGNVFTKENLKAIQQVEERFYNDDKFQEFCLLDSNGNCTKASSVIRYFDGSMKMVHPVFDDPDFDNIPLVLNTSNALPTTKAMLQMFLGKDSNIDVSQNLAQSQITQSFLPVGLPLPGYVNSTDRRDEQDDKIEKFMGSVFLPIMKDYAEKGVNGMDFIYNSRALFGSFLMQQSIRDMMLAGGSIAFLFCFMWFQTGSLWITGWAIFSIIASFFGTNLIYRFVLDFRYFGTFNILSIFIILGIGADDVFVFTDTWKATGHYEYPSIAHRMSDCYRKAAAAMFYTSLTTSVAFIVSTTSPLLSISSFGVFSGVLVIANYISVIIFFPTVVITYHNYWEKCKCCCCAPCAKGKKTDIQNGAGNPDDRTGSGPALPVVSDDHVSDVHLSTTQIPPIPCVSYSAFEGEDESHQRRNLLVRFFRGHYFHFITRPSVKWLVLLFFIILTTVFIYFAAQLQPNEEQIKFVAEDSNFGKALDRSANAFQPSQTDGSVKVYIIWGLALQDISQCHMTDLTCLGRTVWDDHFDMNPASSQQALLNFCHKMKTLPESDIEKLKIRKDIVTGIPEVMCFVDDMNDFFDLEPSAIPPRYPNGTNLTLPLLQADATDIMTYNPTFYNISMLGANFTQHFEIGLSFWMKGGFHSPSTAADNYRKYNSLLGEEEINGVTVGKDIPTLGTYKYGTRLRYAAIVVNTTLAGSTLSYPKGLPVRNEWENFVNSEVQQMPQSLRGGFQTTPVGYNTWHWLKVQESLTSTALNGILIGVGLSFPVLIIATKNILTGLFAVLNISLVTVAVVGLIPMAGWKLGILESINLVLVVGLAVDYTVHLAEGYSRSTHHTRRGRVYDMLDEVGISVISGAFTTLGSSMFMLFAKILFFSQFGLFMFCTIGFSILYALGFFVAILAICGPQEEFGSLKSVFCFWKKTPSTSND